MYGVNRYFPFPKMEFNPRDDVSDSEEEFVYQSSGSQTPTEPNLDSCDKSDDDFQQLLADMHFGNKCLHNEETPETHSNPHLIRCEEIYSELDNLSDGSMRVYQLLDDFFRALTQLYPECSEIIIEVDTFISTDDFIAVLDDLMALIRNNGSSQDLHLFLQQRLFPKATGSR